MNSVPMILFGHDHWGLLAYIECCIVDNPRPTKNIAELDKRRLRCNPKRHPLHNVNANHGVNTKWKPEYGTRLRGYSESKDAKLLLKEHDDYDCMNDLEAAGLIDVMSEANVFVGITNLGKKLAAMLRDHKASGGSFSSFHYKKKAR